MANPLTADDVSGGAGCAHDRVSAVRAAVGDFFQSRPLNITQTVQAQLKASLEMAAGRPLTNAQVARAVRLWVEGA